MPEITKKKCISNVRPIILYNLDNTVYNTFNSIKEATKSINCNEKTIRRALNSESKVLLKK